MQVTAWPRAASRFSRLPRFVVGGRVSAHDAQLRIRPIALCGIDCAAIGRNVDHVVIDTAAFTVPPPEKDELGASFRSRLPPTNLQWHGPRVRCRSFAKQRGQQLTHRRRARFAADHRRQKLASILAAHHARKSDGSRFSSETIPRIKVEYQISPPFSAAGGPVAARSRSALVIGTEIRSSSTACSTLEKRRTSSRPTGYSAIRPCRERSCTRIWIDARRAARIQIPGSAANTRRVLRQDQLSLRL